MKNDLFDLFSELNKNRIDYVYLGKMPITDKMNEVYYSAESIIIQDNDLIKSRDILKKKGRKCFHPYSVLDDWMYLYDLKEFEMWRLYSEKETFINVSNRLYVKSLMPKTWLPLDNSLQKYLWQTKRFDKEQGYFIPDDNTLYMNTIINCIFDKLYFDNDDIRIITSVSLKLDYDLIKGFLEGVFFSFTPILFDMIDHSRFDAIRGEYIKFIGY